MPARGTPLEIGKGRIVREGAMVVGFGLYGVPADVAIAVSITYGLAILVTSLPGGILWLMARRSTPPKTTGVAL